ncbi:hypothetical protein [Geodermatophilus sp. SYSU D00710]
MKTLARTGLVAAAALAAVVTGATSASAAPSSGSGTAPVANPAQACATIQNTVAEYGGTLDDFRYSSCVKTLAGRVPTVEGAGDPYGQCEVYEQEGLISYPYTFYAEGGPFPSLRANSREQCARALYAYHTIASAFPEQP